MHFDTVRLRFPVLSVKNDKFYKIEGSRAGELTFKIFKDTIRVGSFSYDINLFISNDVCTIEYSVPKFFNGNNVDSSNCELLDFHRSTHIIKKELENFIITPSVQDWELLRIDISDYIDSINPYETMAFFQNLSMIRRKRYVYDTSVQFVGATVTTKLYIKKDEFFKHDYKEIARVNIHEAEKLLKLANNKIRIETTIRAKAIRRITKYKKVTLKRLTSNSYKKLEKHVIQQNKQLLRLQKANMKKRDLLKELQIVYSRKKAIELYQFFQLWTSSPLQRKLLKESYSRWTINRKLAMIDKALI